MYDFLDLEIQFIQLLGNFSIDYIIDNFLIKKHNLNKTRLTSEFKIISFSYHLKNIKYNLR